MKDKKKYICPYIFDDDGCYKKSKFDESGNVRYCHCSDGEEMKNCYLNNGGKNENE